MGRGNRRFFKRFTKFFRRTRQAAAFDKRSRKTAKLSIYKTWKTWYFDIGSFPISHPLGPHGVCPCGSFLCHEENRPAPGGFRSFLSPSSPPFAVHAAVQIRHLPLGGGEEALQLVLKGLIPGRRQGLRPSPALELRRDGPGGRRRPGPPGRAWGNGGPAAPAGAGPF